LLGAILEHRSVGKPQFYSLDLYAAAVDISSREEPVYVLAAAKIGARNRSPRRSVLCVAGDPPPAFIIGSEEEGEAHLMIAIA